MNSIPPSHRKRIEETEEAIRRALDSGVTVQRLPPMGPWTDKEWIDAGKARRRRFRRMTSTS